jgi:conjugal transfer pilus assembly protein TraB
MKKLREIFSKLKPGQKKVVSLCILTGIFLGVVWVSWKLKQSGIEEVRANQAPKSMLTEPVLEPELIEISRVREQRAQLEALRQELDDIKNKPVQERVVVIKDKKKVPGVKVTVEGDQVVKDYTEKKGPDSLETKPDRSAYIPDADSIVPVPPKVPNIPSQGNLNRPRHSSSLPTPPGGAAASVPAPPKEEYVGGIGLARNPEAAHVDSDGVNARKGSNSSKKKDKNNVVFLPPSFMEATLLTGFDASTTGGRGSGGSEPVMLRVQTPAILPNYVKAQLEGCFIIAEARGNLSKERAEIRLNTLSCIGKNGTSVINEGVKGFVVDGEDGKNSLSGRVVSKMGAAAARALIAGLFEGVGDAFSASASTQTLSPLGSTQIVDNDELKRNAVGQGITRASEQLTELYMDLAKQTSPVIEVLPAQKVTVVVSEGVELHIKNYERVGGGNEETI